MNKIPSHFGFYSILTDPVRGYEYCTKLLVEYKVAFVQLRMKNTAEKQIIKTAEMMRRITHGTKTKLIINDCTEVAVRVNADGVHLGQTDMPFLQARAIAGEQAIIGISTHNPDQTQKACMLQPDYIGIGPVFPTPTKANPDPVIGIEGMKKMLAAATVPAVAIGGITPENLPHVLAAGAKNFSLVRPLNQAQEPEKVLKEILAIYKKEVEGAYEI